MKDGSANATPSWLALEAMLDLNAHYSFFFFILTVALLTYKAFSLYYPASMLGWDFVNIFLYGFVEASRLFFISRGNKIADLESLFWGGIFCIPIIALHGYYINLQTYVLRVDTVLNAISLFFVSAEMIATALVFAFFYYKSRRF